MRLEEIMNGAPCSKLKIINKTTDKKTEKIENGGKMAPGQVVAQSLNASTSSSHRYTLD